MIISQEELSSFVNVKNAQPHDRLGMHLVQRKGQTNVVVRAYFPGAKTCSVISTDTRKIYPMVQLDPSGFFEGIIRKKKIFPYKLQVIDSEGTIDECEDPYRFMPTFSDYDQYLFNSGKHEQIAEKLGAHIVKHEGVEGTAFSVWAPSAQRVSVVGDFNRWDGRCHMMRLLGNSGVWELFVPKNLEGVRYKFEILGANNALFLKSDPYGNAFEGNEQHASIVYKSRYTWQDTAYQDQQRSDEQHNWEQRPLSIYEVHLESWRRVVEEQNRPLTYQELAVALCTYVKEMGFSHIELMPITEYPFSGSWGYQVTGFFAPTYRYGTPDDFRYFVDYCHQQGVGVIVDWVPAHFPRDAFALASFDGTHLYEHADPRQGEHKDWGTYIFNYERHEVRNFLIGSALYWLREFHIDGIRIDAVASMLYLDYSRNAEDWIPNRYGGHENIAAIEFLRELNDTVHKEFPNALMIAEESTSFGGVTHSTKEGGLGFDMKWNMGWMHDTLAYFSQSTLARKYHHNQLTFGMLYQNSEKFILALSHDEVVHGKSSLINKMPGSDMKEKSRHLRALYGLMWGWPGKKLLFMGDEFGQSHEWDYRNSLDWHLLQYPDHQSIQHWVRDLNHFYQKETFLGASDFDPNGFYWAVVDDCDNSVFGFFRKDEQRYLLVMSNLTPVLREHYRVGVPHLGFWKEVLNSDATCYDGAGVGNLGGCWSQEGASHGQPYHLDLTLPGLSTLFFLFEVKK